MVDGDDLSLASRGLQPVGGFWSPVGIAWLAAWIDADGWVCPREIGIRITDQDVLERIKEMTQMGNVKGPIQGTNLPLWEWRVYNGPDKARIALAVYPLMSVRRKIEIGELADHIKNQKHSRAIAVRDARRREENAAD